MREICGFREFAPGTDKFSTHRAYLPVYSKLFAKFRFQERAMLEIGVDGGGSLLMWQDYLKRAVVTGMDINHAPPAIADAPNVRHVQTDAYQLDAVREISPLAPFSIIIDDGNHFLESQMFFCTNYSKLLTDDGILLVEDVQKQEYIPELAKCIPPDIYSFAVDVRHENGTPDDLLFVAFRR